MELSSAPLHKGQIPWRGLLLTASLLTCWNSPATAQVTVEAVPPLLTEGESVYLVVHRLPEDLKIFYWYRLKEPLFRSEIARYTISTGKNLTGPAYSGRETIYPNGTLLLRNANAMDAGDYEVHTLANNFDLRITRARFHVHPSSL